MGLQAKDKKVDLATLAKDRRESFCTATFVTKTNVQDVIARAASPKAEWNNLYARVAGPVVYR
jgi:ribose transport system substrate-binding protein